MTETAWLYEPRYYTNALLEARRDAMIMLKCNGVDDDNLTLKLVKCPEMYQAIHEYEDVLIRNDHNYIPVNNADEYLGMIAHIRNWRAVARNLADNYGAGEYCIERICKLIQFALLDQREWMDGWVENPYTIDPETY